MYFWEAASTTAGAAAASQPQRSCVRLLMLGEQHQPCIQTSLATRTTSSSGACFNGSPDAGHGQPTPCFSVPAPPGFAELFASFLGVQLVTTNSVPARPGREGYFEEAKEWTGTDHLFLDPDTGIAVPDQRNVGRGHIMAAETSGNCPRATQKAYVGVRPELPPQQQRCPIASDQGEASLARQARCARTRVIAPTRISSWCPQTMTR